MNKTGFWLTLARTLLIFFTLVVLGLALMAERMQQQIKGLQKRRQLLKQRTQTSGIAEEKKLLPKIEDVEEDEYNGYLEKDNSSFAE